MVLRLASEHFQYMDKALEEQVACLRDLDSMESWKPTEKILLAMPKFSVDPPEFSADLHNFAKICRRDPVSTLGLLVKLQEKINLGQLLYGRVIGRKKELFLPEVALSYLIDIQSCFSSLSNRLRKEIKALERVLEGKGTIYFDTFSEIPVSGGIGALSAAPHWSAGIKISSSDGGSPPGMPPKVASEEEEQLQEGSSPQDVFWPAFLKKLKLTQKEVQRIRTVLLFIKRAREKGDKTYYNLDKYNQRILVCLVAELDHLLERRSRGHLG